MRLKVSFNVKRVVVDDSAGNPQVRFRAGVTGSRVRAGGSSPRNAIIRLLKELSGQPAEALRKLIKKG